jgi:large subunit ribosomal protein L18
MKENKNSRRITRHKRIRAKIKGTIEVPRLGVFRSNKHIYAQLVDDEAGKIILLASDLELKKKSGKKSELAHRVGELLAKKALDLPAAKKIEKVIFDRGGYQYHGRIKALAEGARKGGLKF